MKKLDRSYKLFLVFLVLMGIIPLISNTKFIFANGDISLPVYTNFEMTEYSTLEGTDVNVNSINLNLPSNSWNIDDLQLNLTDIVEQDKEILSIEDKNYPGVYTQIYFQNTNFRRQGLAAQIELNKSETLYGVYIYGKKQIMSFTKTIQVQIRGYDIGNNNPNNTIYLNMDINMSSTEGWYIQNFTTPITLPKGNYFLVLNGSNIITSGDDRYHWYYNNIDPTNPSLLISEYDDTDTWSSGIGNSPYLYKLIREKIFSIYPEDYNMTVLIDDQDYKILNGTDIGTGNLLLKTLNFSPPDEDVSFPIFNNYSALLLFNVSYTMNVSNIFSSTSSVIIKRNITNEWKTTPTIIRNSNNYSVRFSFPLSWQNISIFKDLANISSSVIINTFDNYIIIPNDTITDGAEWEIKAYSPNILLEIYAPKTDYLTGQELRFSVLNPIAGNYTFLLTDPSGFEEHRFSRLNPPSDYFFSYEVPSNAVEGSYFAYIFFYNGTDAGVTTQEFLISLASSNPSNNPIGLIIGIIVIVGSIMGILSFIAARKIISKRREGLESILSKCNDIINLEYIIVLETRSGIDIFSQSFTDKKVDTTLISGFLQAIRTFGAEMSEEAKTSRTVKLEYKKSIMLMTEFVNLKLIIIMKDNPSPNFIYLLEDLSYDIYKNYGKNIDDFKGNIKQFRGIKNLVEKHLNISFLYPLRVSMNEKVKLNQTEKEMMNKALNFMKENNFDHFYSLYLLPANMCTPSDYKTILNLIQKGIFQPVND